MDNSELYFLGIIPSLDLQDQVLQLKQFMQQKYKAFHALKSPAHITLFMPFRQAPEFEETLCMGLKNFAITQARFSVQLENFGRFSNRVIFIKVLENRTLAEMRRKLLKSLSSYTQLIKPELLDNAKAEKFRPHITIATRDLEPESFKLAWADFTEKSFEAEFETKEICLFKHTGSHWQVHELFRLAV